MNRGYGLASLNRYFGWGSELRPWPGELEYLNGAELRLSLRGSMTGIRGYNRNPQPWLKSVTDNAYSYARDRR